MVGVREAATVLLVDDLDERLHVFMQRRNPRVEFVPGASVFPGGAVDPGDRSAALYERVLGLDDATASTLLGCARDGLAYWVAAIRETFEESGILLSGAEVDPDLRATMRTQLNAGTSGFLELLERHDLTLDAGDVHVFSHWLTPEGAPRRYDTWFFVAPIPAGQRGVHDDGEAIESELVAPPVMLDRFARGEVDLIFPTLRSLRVIEDFPSAGDLLSRVAASSGDRLAPPLVVDDGTGERIALEPHERAVARTGWRALENPLARDLEAFDAEMSDFIARRTGVA